MFYASTVFGIATMLIPVSGAKNCVMTPTEVGIYGMNANVMKPILTRGTKNNIMFL